MSDEIRQRVHRFLEALGIETRSIRHDAAPTLEDCAAVSRALGATVCKNYFLTTKSKKVYALCVVRPEARLKTADISKQVGTPRLTFADEEELTRFLSVMPGSVSPFGLIFDETKSVRLLMDRGLADLAELAFHPCDNTETVAIRTEDFLQKFLPALGVSVEWVEIHDFLA